MKYRIFTYPVPCDEAVAELNQFPLVAPHSAGAR